METANLDELIHFDWNIIKEKFQDNTPNQELTLIFAYVNKTERDENKVRVDNFEFKLTGKTSDLEKITEELKRTFKTFSNIDGKAKE